MGSDLNHLTSLVHAQLNVRPARAKHRIQTTTRYTGLGGTRFGFGCRCGHETKGYTRAEDALSILLAHMVAAEAREKEEESGERVTLGSGARG